jgi:hypothetical protein
MFGVLDPSERRKDCSRARDGELRFDLQDGGGLAARSVKVTQSSAGCGKPLAEVPVSWRPAGGFGQCGNGRRVSFQLANPRNPAASGT